MTGMIMRWMLLMILSNQSPSFKLFKSKKKSIKMSWIHTLIKKKIEDRNNSKFFCKSCNKTQVAMKIIMMIP